VPFSCCVRCELLVTPEQHYHSTTVSPPRLERGGDPAVVPVSERPPGPVHLYEHPARR
jgi:hypothetical protein